MVVRTSNGRKLATPSLVHRPGGAIKANTQKSKGSKDAWVEGYLVTWGDESDTDLQGEFFDSDTNFCLDWFDDRPILYHHGLDGEAGLRKIGRIKTLEVDELGLWVQGQLDLRDRYAEAVYDMVKSKEFGWSSGSVDHLVEIAPTGKILVWPLIEGSITPTPAQPSKTTVRAFKSYPAFTPAPRVSYRAYKSLFDANDSDYIRGLDSRIKSVISSRIKKAASKLSREDEQMLSDLEEEQTREESSMARSLRRRSRRNRRSYRGNDRHDVNRMADDIATNMEDELKAQMESIASDIEGELRSEIEDEAALAAEEEAVTKRAARSIRRRAIYRALRNIEQEDEAVMAQEMENGGKRYRSYRMDDENDRRSYRKRDMENRRSYRKRDNDRNKKRYRSYRMEEDENKRYRSRDEDRNKRYRSSGLDDIRAQEESIMAEEIAEKAYMTGFRRGVRKSQNNDNETKKEDRMSRKYYRSYRSEDRDRKSREDDDSTAFIRGYRAARRSLRKREDENKRYRSRDEDRNKRYRSYRNEGVDDDGDTRRYRMNEEDRNKRYRSYRMDEDENKRYRSRDEDRNKRYRSYRNEGVDDDGDTRRYRMNEEDRNKRYRSYRNEGVDDDGDTRRYRMNEEDRRSYASSGYNDETTRMSDPYAANDDDAMMREDEMNKRFRGKSMRGGQLEYWKRRAFSAEGMEAPGQRSFGSIKSVTDVADREGAYKSAFKSYLTKGLGLLNEREKYVLEGKGRVNWDSGATKSAGSMKTYFTGSDASAGFAVPPDWVAELNKNVMTRTVMAPECRTRTTTSDRIVQTNVVTNDARRAHAARVRWAGEGAVEADHTTLEDDYSQIALPIHTMMISLTASNESLEDATFNLEDEINEAFSEAVALEYDLRIWSGDGQGKIRGIVVDDQVVGSRSTGMKSVGGYVPTGGEDSIPTADVFKTMLFHLPAQYRQSSKWYMNSNTGLLLSTLKDGNGNYLIDQRDESLQTVGVPERLLGRPIVYNEYADDVAANNFPVLFGDLSRGYLIGKRVDFSIRRFDDSNYAVQDKVLFLGRARVGGQVYQPAAIKALKIATS